MSDESLTSDYAPPARPQWKVKALSFLVWLVARSIFSTLRIRFEHSDGFREVLDQGTGAIFVVWHGRTLIPVNVFRNRGFWALISLSRDGEVQNGIFQRFGFKTIRGSTGRGGVRAVLLLAKRIKEGGILAFTPDGPRGPTHKVQGGTIFLAQRSGRPIIPFGASANPRKLLGSWDSYLVPIPFGRAAVVTGDPIYVPSEATQCELDRITEALECALNEVENRAEALAVAKKAVGTKR